MLAGTLAAATAALIALYFFAGYKWRIPVIERWGLFEKLKTVSRTFAGCSRQTGRHDDVAPGGSSAFAARCRICRACCGLGLGIPVETLFALTPAALLIAMVPVSVGGWGVREVTLIYVLGTAGVDATAALSLSMAFGLLRIFVGAFGGLAWVVMNETHFRVVHRPPEPAVAFAPAVRPRALEAAAGDRIDVATQVGCIAGTGEDDMHSRLMPGITVGEIGEAVGADLFRASSRSGGVVAEA